MSNITSDTETISTTEPDQYGRTVTRVERFQRAAQKHASNNAVIYMTLFIILLILVLAIIFYRYFAYGYVWNPPPCNCPSPTNNMTTVTATNSLPSTMTNEPTASQRLWNDF